MNYPFTQLLRRGLQPALSFMLLHLQCVQAAYQVVALWQFTQSTMNWSNCEPNRCLPIGCGGELRGYLLWLRPASVGVSATSQKVSGLPHSPSSPPPPAGYCQQQGRGGVKRRQSPPQSCGLPAGVLERIGLGPQVAESLFPHPP